MSVELFDMKTPLDLGEPRIDDVLAIADLWQQIGDDNTGAIRDDPETLRTVMAGLDYLVLRDPNKRVRLVGAVSILDCRRQLAKIDSLAVHPNCQGQGHGFSLAREAVVLCQRRGFNQIVTTAMPSSQGIFTSLGFETFETYDSGNASMFLDLP